MITKFKFLAAYCQQLLPGEPLPSSPAQLLPPPAPITGAKTYPVPGTSVSPIAGATTYPIPGAPASLIAGATTYPIAGTPASPIPGTTTPRRIMCKNKWVKIVRKSDEKRER